MLQGKVAIVSGIGPGMGQHIALRLAEHGADVVLAARGADKLQEVAAAVEALGRRAVQVPTDIADADACQRLVDNAVSALGGVDILVNNAFHAGDYTPFLDADLAQWRTTFDVNFWGTLQLTRSAAQVMAERGGGSIVMINTMSMQRIAVGFGAYAASKGALATVTKTLALELGPRKIRVNGVHPGYIWGDSVRGYFEAMAAERGVAFDQVYDEHASETALRRFPDAREISGTVLYLASELSDGVTGQAVSVNGGQYFQSP
jgi:NAD(P)-dependent dehydrogenase (short-subunit alcohol dehydrogenase family)